MERKFLTVKQFAEQNPAFTVGCLRCLIFNADYNGMTDNQVIYRVGAKILIDVDNFYRWIETNPTQRGTQWTK